MSIVSDAHSWEECFDGIGSSFDKNESAHRYFAHS
jgi:hypothetical protein